MKKPCSGLRPSKLSIIAPFLCLVAFAWSLTLVPRTANAVDIFEIVCFDGCEECTCDKDCDDYDPCTADWCDSDGKCHHEPCECECKEDSDCDDYDPCTKDWCDSDGKCHHEPCECECKEDSDCDDYDRCTKDTCEYGECKNEPGECECKDHNDCDDYNPCTKDTCDYGECKHEPCECEPECKCDTECDDNNNCTADSCGEDGKCHHDPCPCEPECSCDDDCDDHNPCTADSCNHDGKCEHTPCACEPECTCDEDCKDGDECTVDMCIDGRCEHKEKDDCRCEEDDCVCKGDCPEVCTRTIGYYKTHCNGPAAEIDFGVIDQLSCINASSQDVWCPRMDLPPGQGNQLFDQLVAAILNSKNGAECGWIDDGIECLCAGGCPNEAVIAGHLDDCNNSGKEFCKDDAVNVSDGNDTNNLGNPEDSGNSTNTGGSATGGCSLMSSVSMNAGWLALVLALPIQLLFRRSSRK